MLLLSDTPGWDFLLHMLLPPVLQLHFIINKSADAFSKMYLGKSPQGIVLKEKINQMNLSNDAKRFMYVVMNALSGTLDRRVLVAKVPLLAGSSKVSPSSTPSSSSMFLKYDSKVSKPSSIKEFFGPVTEKRKAEVLSPEIQEPEQAPVTAKGLFRNLIYAKLHITENDLDQFTLARVLEAELDPPTGTDISKDLKIAYFMASKCSFAYLFASKPIDLLALNGQVQTGQLPQLNGLPLNGNLFLNFFLRKTLKAAKLQQLAELRLNCYLFFVDAKKHIAFVQPVWKLGEGENNKKYFIFFETILEKQIRYPDNGKQDFTLIASAASTPDGPELKKAINFLLNEIATQHQSGGGPS